MTDDEEKQIFDNNVNSAIDRIKSKLTDTDAIVGQDIFDRVKTSIGNGARFAMNLNTKKADTFSITFCTQDTLKLKTIINSVTASDSNISAASVYGVTQGEYRNHIMLKITAIKSGQPYVTPAVDVSLVNKVNDNIRALKLSPEDTDIAETIQRYIINIHSDQSVVNWSFLRSANQANPNKQFSLKGSDVVSLDLFYLAHLLDACPSIEDIEYKPPVLTSLTGKFSVTFTCNYIDFTARKGFAKDRDRDRDDEESSGFFVQLLKKFTTK
jgi:hypothetical protein